MSAFGPPRSNNGPTAAIGYANRRGSGGGYGQFAANNDAYETPRHDDYSNDTVIGSGHIGIIGSSMGGDRQNMNNGYTNGRSDYSSNGSQNNGSGQSGQRTSSAYASDGRERQRERGNDRERGQYGGANGNNNMNNGNGNGNYSQNNVNGRSDYSDPYASYSSNSGTPISSAVINGMGVGSRQQYTGSPSPLQQMTNMRSEASATATSPIRGGGSISTSTSTISDQLRQLKMKSNTRGRTPSISSSTPSSNSGNGSGFSSNSGSSGSGSGSAANAAAANLLGSMSSISATGSSLGTPTMRAASAFVRRTTSSDEVDSSPPTPLTNEAGGGYHPQRPVSNMGISRQNNSGNNGNATPQMFNQSPMPATRNIRAYELTSSSSSSSSSSAYGSANNSNAPSVNSSYDNSILNPAALNGNGRGQGRRRPNDVLGSVGGGGGGPSSPSNSSSGSSSGFGSSALPSGSAFANGGSGRGYTYASNPQQATPLSPTSAPADYPAVPASQTRMRKRNESEPGPPLFNNVDREHREQREHERTDRGHSVSSPQPTSFSVNRTQHQRDLVAQGDRGGDRGGGNFSNQYAEMMRESRESRESRDMPASTSVNTSNSSFSPSISMSSDGSHYGSNITSTNSSNSSTTSVYRPYSSTFESTPSPRGGGNGDGRGGSPSRTSQEYASSSDDRPIVNKKYTRNINPNDQRARMDDPDDVPAASVATPVYGRGSIHAGMMASVFDSNGLLTRNRGGEGAIRPSVISTAPIPISKWDRFDDGAGTSDRGTPTLGGSAPQSVSSSLVKPRAKPTRPKLMIPESPNSPGGSPSSAGIVASTPMAGGGGMGVVSPARPRAPRVPSAHPSGSASTTSAGGERGSFSGSPSSGSGVPGAPAASRLDEGNYVDSCDLQAYAQPNSEVAAIMKALTSSEWSARFDSITNLRRLIIHHSSLMLPHSKAIIRDLRAEVNSLRSSIAKNSIMCLCDSFQFLSRGVEGELEHIAPALLKRAGEPSGFLRDEANRALLLLLQYCSDRHILPLLLNSSSTGTKIVKTMACVYIDRAVETYGARSHGAILLSNKEFPRLLKAIGIFSSDAAVESRTHSRWSLIRLAQYMGIDELDRMMKKILPPAQYHAVQKVLSKGMDKLESELASGVHREEPSAQQNAIAAAVAGREATANSKALLMLNASPKRSFGSSPPAQPDFNDTNASIDEAADLIKSNRASRRPKLIAQTSSSYLQSTSSSYDTDDPDSAAILTPGPVPTPSRQSAKRRVAPSSISTPTNASLNATSSSSVSPLLQEALMVILADAASSDWRTRMASLDKLQSFITTSPVAASANVTKIFEVLCARINDHHGKVNVAALQSLNQIIPLTKSFITPVLSSFIPSLATNLSSSNPLIRSLSQSGLDMLIRTLTSPVNLFTRDVQSALLAPFAQAALFEASKIRPSLIQQLTMVVMAAADACDTMGQPALLSTFKAAIPVVYSICDEARSEMRTPLMQLTHTLFGVLGAQIWDDKVCAQFHIAPSQVGKIKIILNA